MADYKFNEIFELAQKLDKVFKDIGKESKIIHDNLKKLSGVAPLKTAAESAEKLSTSQAKLVTNQKELNDLRNQTSKINSRAIKEADKITASIDKQNILNKERVNQLKREKREEAKLIISKRKIDQLRRKEVKSDKELIDLNRRLAQVRANLTKNTRANRKEYAKLTKEIVKNEKVIRKNDASIGRFQRNVGNYTGALKGFASSLGLVSGTLILGNLIRDSVELAAKGEGIKEAFGKLNDPGLLKNLRTATRGTVTDLELMKAAVKASNFKIPLKNLATYFEFATKRAAETGESVDYLVESIVNGIARKSTPILDNLGISASEVQKEFKKTGDFALATGNIIASELEKMGDVGLTSAQQLDQLRSAFTNISTELGVVILPYLIKFAKGIKSIIDEVSNLRKFGTLSPAVEEAEKLNQQFFEINENLSKENRLANLSRLKEQREAQIESGVKLLKATKSLFGINALLSKQDQEKVKRTKLILDIYRTQLKLLEGAENTSFFKDIETKKPFLTEEELKALEDERKKLAEERKKQNKEADRLQKEKEKIYLADFKAYQEIELSKLKLSGASNSEIEALTLKHQAELLQYELAFNNDITEAQKESLEIRIELLEKEQEEILKKGAETTQKLINNINAQIQSYKKTKGSILSRLFGVSEDDAEQIEDILIDTTSQLLNELGNAIVNNAQRQTDAIDELISKQDEQISKTQDQLNTELNRIDTLKKAGQAYDDTLANALKNKLAREEAARRQTEIALKESRQREKRAAIAQANINLASGIMQIWGGKGTWVVKLAQTIALGILGSVQIGNIARQEFSTGTDFVSLNGNPKGTDTVPVNLDEGEGVIETSVNKNIPYNKGFKRSMIPMAAEMYLNHLRTPQMYVNDNTIGNNLLKGIEKNTRKDKVFSNGKLVTEYFDNMIIHYG
jgi:hypothetical protein